MNSAGGASEYTGMLDGLTKVAKQEGFTGLYKVPYPCRGGIIMLDHAAHL